MGELKNKIYDVIKDPQMMPLATVTADGKPWVRIVIGAANPELEVRFVTSLKTRKVDQIKASPEVHLTGRGASPDYGEPYVQIAGRAEITTDEQERHSMWKEELKAYFSGPEDPNYAVVIVKPYRIEYMGTSMVPEIWEP